MRDRSVTDRTRKNRSGGGRLEAPERNAAAPTAMKRLLPVAALAALALARCGSTAGDNATDGPDGGPPSGSSSGSHPGSSSGAKKDASKPSGSSGSSSGSTSGSSSGSASGSSSGAMLDDGAGHPACKRGIASNTAPGNVFSPTATNAGVRWWYDWSNTAPGGAPPGMEFVPMIWGTGNLSGPIPSDAHFLMGFNEPNFANQSNMSAQQVAENWPAIEALAKAQGIPIVSPGVNFCGSATDSSNCADPSVTDPYTYLKEFFAACSGCEVDYIAVHWYNCDVESLQAYIEGNSSLEGFTQFGKPIWLTEFCCDNSHPVSDQQSYMEQAVQYLENNTNVFRYSWFSAAPIPNALLTAPDGSLSDLGQTYVSLPQNCE